MAWEIEYSSRCEKALSKLDKQASNDIIDYMEGITKLDNPRIRGEALKGPLGDYWRYRVGDFRVMCEIIDEVLRVMVVKIARRDKVYK